jgi:small GTP-binding protein
MSESVYTFKIVIGGAGRVGKTTLLIRYLKNIFQSDTTLTIGVGFYNKDVIRPGVTSKLAIWDLGGQDRFRVVQSQYVAGAKAAIVFFDMSSLDTMQQIGEWITLFRTSANASIPILLCGTKEDLLPPGALESVSVEAANALEKYGLVQFYPTSSKTGRNVAEVFDHIVDLLLASVGMK